VVSRMPSGARVAAMSTVEICIRSGASRDSAEGSKESRYEYTWFLYATPVKLGLCMDVRALCHHTGVSHSNGHSLLIPESSPNRLDLPAWSSMASRSSISATRTKSSPPTCIKFRQLPSVWVTCCKAAAMIIINP
jgi:hypothetical protein